MEKVCLRCKLPCSVDLLPIKNKVCSLCKKERNRDNCKKWQKDHPEKLVGYRLTPQGKYKNYQHRAKRKGIEWNLTFEEFMTFWQKPCFYHPAHSISTVGIDRIDSDIGYRLNNCRSCCRVCNKMKSDYTEEFWFNHMRELVRYHDKINIVLQ